MCTKLMAYSITQSKPGIRSFIFSKKMFDEKFKLLMTFSLSLYLYYTITIVERKNNVIRGKSEETTTNGFFSIQNMCRNPVLFVWRVSNSSIIL